jgi:uncharacterized membrane protein SpoIIM required for sporulation
VVAMSFCSRCGRQVGTDALFCPNCGAPLTLQPIQHAIQSPKLVSSFRKYFSKPFIGCIILSSILIFSVLIVSGNQGKQVTVEQAQQIVRAIEKEMGDFTALNIFSNNLQIALISFLPIIGSVWMIFVQYNTGYLFGNIAKAYGVDFFSLILLTLGSPTGLLEYSAYILTLSESFVIVYSIVKKKIRKRLSEQTWKTLFIVIGFLLIGGIVEAVSIGIPII